MKRSGEGAPHEESIFSQEEGQSRLPAESPVKVWRDGGRREKSSRAGVRAGEKAWGSEGAELVLGTNGLECQAQGWGVSRKWQHQVCGEAWTWVPCESPLQRTEPGPRGLPSLGWIADQRDGSRLEGCAGGRGTGLGEAEERGLWCLAVPQAGGGALYLPQQSPQGCSQQDSTGMRVRWHSAGETAQERRR